MAEAPPRLFHASPSANRESIHAHGLDISRMSMFGIAGSPCAEAEGVFLSDDVRDSFWYASFGAHANVDIWEVRAEGFSLQEDNEDWICGAVIQPDRLTLIEADISPDAAVAWLDAEPSTGLLSRVEDRSDQGFDGHERMP